MPQRRFTRVSHLRISSHHRDIDKARYPDIGMRGQVVREKLHGRTAQGTWVQLEKTPAYLSPDLAVPVSLPPPVAESLALALSRISAADDTTAVSHDLAGRFRPSGQANPSNELGQALSGRGGRGLFGNSKVWVTESPVRSAAAILDQLREQPDQAAWWAGAGLS